MGFMDEYNKALQENKQKSNANSSGGSSSGGSSGGSSPKYVGTGHEPFYKKTASRNVFNKNNKNTFDAPVSKKLTSSYKKKKKEEESKKERKWFDKGLFDDGYDFGDVSRTILGTTTDVLENLGSGIIGMGEKAVDAMAYIAPYVENGQFYQNGGGYNLELQQQHEKVVEQSKKELSKFIAKDLYDEEKVARAIISDPARKIGIDSETQSVFGEKSDALIQSGGQLLATAGLQAVGVPWFVTTGATSFGSEAENALNQGASYEAAGASAAISAGAEILSEKLSGGISFGGKTLDDALTKQLARGISNKLGRTAAKLGLDMAGEGAEEVFSQIASNLGSALYKEEDITELLFNEEAMEGYLESFIGGAALGGVSNTFNAVKSAAKGVDYTSGLTKNEQVVVDKLYKDEIAQKEGKVTEKEKAKIYDSILEKMEKGYISTDTIEEVLGGEKYNQYKQAADWESSLQTEYDTLSKEYDELYNMKNGEKSSKQVDREAELKEMLPGLKAKLDNVLATSTVGQQKSQLTNDVYELTKNDKLTESYNQRYQSSQKYQADVTKYDAKQQTVVQKAIDSGILNNSRRTHEFVDFIAKVSADKGVLFDFTNNAKLKESGFAVDGKQVNGFVTKDGITLNIDSAKAMNTTVGHEITHVLEGTEFYDSMKQTIFEYAKAKGEYQSRYDSIAEMYKDVKDADIEGELTADLVGDYLFSDSDFINNLSTQNRNVFQKIYDEVKYLCKVVTAGSKEARELERVKKAFEQAYREGGKAQAETKYSLNIKHTDGTVEELADARGLTTEQAVDYLYQAKSGSLRRDTYIPVRSDTPQVLIDTLEQVNEHVENLSLVMNVDKAQGAMAVENPGTKTKKYGDNVRKHGLSPEEIIEIISNLDNPHAVIYQTNRRGKNGKALPNSVAVFVEFTSEGREGMAAVEFENPRNTDSIGTEYGEVNYHTVVTVFEPDVERHGMPYDYVEELLSDPNNYELKIERRQPTESATGEKHPNTSNELPSYKASLSQNGENVNNSLEQNEHGLNRKEEVSFSLSNDTAYMDKAIAMNASSLRVDSKTLEETKALRERIAARMNDIKDRGLVGLPEDIEGNTYIANSSYDGTEENTTICPRSLASEAFVDAVSEYLGRPLTVEEQIYISQDLQGRSLTPECTYCYVATDRKAYRAFLGDYVAQRDAVLQKVKENPNADVSRSGDLYKEFLNGRKDTNPMYSRFKMWVDAYKNGKPMIDASHLANINKLMGDINSEFGAELKPQITDAMKYAQSASWAKKRVNYVAYNGHILKWKQDRINKLNSHYGLRMYSFSDFHPAFVLENMQMITDASVRGLKMLGYTKDTDFVDIFAPSGMNINISTFGFETGGNVFENNLIGAEWEKAKALRDQYPNVGITFVATNDTLVDWALNQDWIDVVIPFHLVRTGREVAKAFNYHDYTSESSDTKTKEWKKGDKKYIAPTEHNNDKATYLAALEKNHLKPRFERFLENPNYMKLVNECRQPASMSKPVQPVFNEDAAKVALAKLEANGYYQPIGGSVDRMYEIAGEVAEAMTNELAPARSLSDVGEQHTSESLSALRLETAEESSFDAPTVSEAESVPVEAPIYESNDKSAPEGQTAMFEPVEGEKKQTRKEYHQDIIDNIKDRFDEKGFDFDKVLKSAKNLSTWSTVDNTPQRVMEKSLGYKEGGILADITVNKVAQNESEGIKWLNSYVDQLKQISKQYHIKPGSKESAAAQMFAEGFYVNENNEIIRYGEPELIQDFKDPKVRANIKGLARDSRIRKIYDDTLGNINESRARNLYPEIPRLDNYFLHFRAMEDTFSTLGLPFNPNDIRAKDLPTDLNGVTADLKPGQPYFASANHRTGKRTSFDLLGGVERYLNSAKNQIYHIDDIQTLRALRNYIAETYGQASGLEDIDSMTDAEAEERIKQVYDSHLSTFAKFLNEEANVLAGKTALVDRGIEGLFGRRAMTFLNTLKSQVGSNMVGGNVSSSLTNFMPVAQTFAKANKFDFTKAFAQTVANKLSGGKLDTFAQDSPVVIRRKGTDRFAKTMWQKMAEPGYVLMGAVDDISTEIVARTKYNELTRKGMDSQKAHFETDKWVSKLMGDRSLGQQPQLYNSKMFGLLTQFQLEVRNQLDMEFYDTYQEAKASNEQIENALLRNAKTAAKTASVIAQLTVAQHLYGKAFEAIAGYNPAFDIIEVLMTAFGYDDEEDSEDTALDNLSEALLALAEDLPYTSIFTGGRIPISAALPDVNAVLRGEDEYGNEIGVPKAAWEEMKDIAPYYIMPTGYGQAKKTYQGLKMFSDDHPISGSYTDAGNLRYPVEDTVVNKIQAGLFGQYANKNAQKYFDEEQRTLNPDQTAIFAELDIPIEEYWKYRDNLYEFYDVKDALEAAAKADGATDEDILKGKYIKSVYSDIYALYDEQKKIAKGNSPLKKSQLRDIQNQMSNMLTDSKRTVNNVNIDGYYATIGDKRYDYSDYNGAWFEIEGKYLEREQKAIERYGVTPSEYWNNTDMFYDADYYFKYKPELETVSKNVFDGKWFASYAAEVSQIKGDDLNGDGKSDSGTKKKKVFDYIAGLDVSDVEKMILFKMSYPSEDKYNDDIVDYLNDRGDIDYGEMKSILEALGAKVDSEGYITW